VIRRIWCPAFFPKVLYKGRARIEQAVGKLKRFKRIALRCEKTAQNYGSFVAIVHLDQIRPHSLVPRRTDARRHVPARGRLCYVTNADRANVDGADGGAIVHQRGWRSW
jgi:hypothetical protein